MSFGFARLQAINKLATIEDESGRIDPNKVNIFPNKKYRGPCDGISLNVDILNLTFVKLKD